MASAGRSSRRFLVIGCGSIGKRHIDNLKRLDAREILAFDVAVFRCGKLGFGLPPEALEQVIGRTAARALGAESLIRLEDLK